MRDVGDEVAVSAQVQCRHQPKRAKRCAGGDIGVQCHTLLATGTSMSEQGNVGAESHLITNLASSSLRNINEA